MKLFLMLIMFYTGITNVIKADNLPSAKEIQNWLLLNYPNQPLDQHAIRSELNIGNSIYKTVINDRKIIRGDDECTLIYYHDKITSHDDKVSWVYQKYLLDFRTITRISTFWDDKQELYQGVNAIVALEGLFPKIQKEAYSDQDYTKMNEERALYLPISEISFERKNIDLNRLTKALKTYQEACSGKNKPNLF